jgi:hypothetical protein
MKLRIASFRGASKNYYSGFGVSGRCVKATARAKTITSRCSSHASRAGQALSCAYLHSLCSLLQNAQLKVCR